jgi:hypothetical protein
MPHPRSETGSVRYRTAINKIHRDPLAGDGARDRLIGKNLSMGFLAFDQLGREGESPAKLTPLHLGVGCAPP